MTEKQRRFVDYYVKTCNASGAAKQAGYSERSAGQIGWELLSNPEVQSAIQKRLNKMDKKRVADAEENMEFLTKVMRGEVSEEIVTPSGKRIKAGARISDRLRAAEDLLKIEGKFKEQVDVQISGADLLRQTLHNISTKLEASEVI